MIRNFAFFENTNNYVFNNKIVQVIKQFKRSSGEQEVVYLDEFGKQQHYIADSIAEVNDDFVKTDQLYDPIKVKPTPSKRLADKDEYNLVYYIGNKKMETPVKNVTKKKAYALKNSTFKNNPDYSMGRFKVEPVTPQSSKALVEKKEGMIKGYTDPNPKNLDYNWDAIPKRDVKKSEGPNMVKFSEIGIGDNDPVKKFSEWDGNYWEMKKTKKNKSK